MLFRVVQGSEHLPTPQTSLSDIWKKYFNNSQQPLTITLLGIELYSLTNPRDTSEAYRSSPALSFDLFVKVLIRTCGSSKRVVEKLYQDPPSSRERSKSLGRFIHHLQVQQSSGQKLENLSAVFVRCFEKSLVFKNVPIDSRYSSKAPETADFACVSLCKWCSGTILDASQKVCFGDHLSKIDPDLAQKFIEFDTRSWQLLYHYPRLISKPMYAAKDRLIDALTAYFEIPAEKKADAAWVTQLPEREMRELHFTNREMGTFMMLQYWG